MAQFQVEVHVKQLPAERLVCDSLKLWGGL